MSDLVGNPEDRFSHNEAHIFVIVLFPYLILDTLQQSRTILELVVEQMHLNVSLKKKLYLMYMIVL